MSLLLLMSSGCVSTSGQSLDDCVWAKPITWHETDTETTKNEIFAHNLKWEEFCLQEEN